MKKELVKRDITMVGDTEGDEPCGSCLEAKDFFESTTKHDNRITYTKHEVETPEADKIYEKERFKSIPFIRDCKTTRDETGEERTSCRKIEGFDPGDFSDLDKLREQKEKEEEASESSIEEPEE